MIEVNNKIERKNSTTLVLMTSSIVLLLVLQGFWLTNSYEKANLDLRRESNMLFRNTIFIMRDSFISKNIQSIPLDSSNAKSNSLSRGTVPGADNPNPANNNFHVFISSEGDSLSKHQLHPIITRIQEEHHHGRNKFFVRLGSDSLSVDSISIRFDKALREQGIVALFKITHAPVPPPPFERGRHRRNFFRNFEGDTSTNKPIHPFDKTFETEWIHFNPINRYYATLTGFQAGIVKQVLPQIFFSVFLTIVTILSFILLYKSIRSQQKLMALKNDFISNMTHELKTPIATVSVAIEALKDFKAIEDPKRTSEYLTMAQHELNRLSILTDNVLSTTLFEESHLNFIFESVDLQEIIEQVLSSMKLVFERYNVRVSFIKEGNNFVINGSPVHLTNVIYNLIDNAIKYSDQKPNIEIKLSDTGEGIKINVKDYGIGIPADYRDKVFEKFFRVPTGNVHTVKGYGLGLSYVNGVVLQHGGRIYVESKSGIGSEFIISIPVKAKK